MSEPVVGDRVEVVNMSRGVGRRGRVVEVIHVELDSGGRMAYGPMIHVRFPAEVEVFWPGDVVVIGVIDALAELAE